MRFDDDVVIITGAGRGLGREYALAFASRGAAVIVNDFAGTDDAGQGNSRLAQDVVDEIVAAGGRAVADMHSVASADGAKAIIRTALDVFGKITILVNNAGVISFGPLPEVTDAMWKAMQTVTLDGAFFMCREVWPHLVAQGHGRIVNTTSNAGFAGNETLAHYGAAKLGVAGLTKCLAQEAAGTDITVNAVAPMAITRMNRDAFFSGAECQSGDWQADIRTGRAPMGPPQAVAATVLWLAHKSNRLNGEIFSSSSGNVARVAFVLGEGYFNPDHQPEDLRDNAAAVCQVKNFFEPRATQDELILIPLLFQRDW